MYITAHRSTPQVRGEILCSGKAKALKEGALEMSFESLRRQIIAGIDKNAKFF